MTVIPEKQSVHPVSRAARTAGGETLYWIPHQVRDDAGVGRACGMTPVVGTSMVEDDGLRAAQCDNREDSCPRNASIAT
ncbi:hypothetical protein [Pseudovibrio sp. SPO723]|uniref:hypothetical protein n=1 Tax=Nesiotobacter zosterae TaxID=392721 RepID=UPI0029C48A07|nr:hypothetical protein [Pseudovibrio sp. SPO723]MDX5593339.1 hypothetical protein [Pseudovibrio sp. SPO723]